MNLYLFPEAACLNNGYGIGVEFAYNKLSPTDEDKIVWYTDLSRDKMLHLRETDTILQKNKFYSYKSVLNILRGKDRTELGINELDFLRNLKFDNIHCDEVIFYRALRHIFPTKQISLRLHNCFARIYDRKRMTGVKLDWKYETKLKNMYVLEREIFNDPNVYKIFISDEDREYYTSTFGRTSDSETWAYIPDENMIKKNRSTNIMLTHKLVWFGGVESHKGASINWFINEILPYVKNSISDAEFHLYGKNTDRYNFPEKGVFGHGFYDGIGFPENNSLYINPDIIGGGIKLKLMSLIESGVPFISSPFGYEGYSNKLIDDKHVHVVEQEKWGDYIVNLLKGNG